MFYISFIDTAVEFASDPSGEKFEDVLIDALFVGFGLYLNGSGDETSGGKGFIDVLKEIFPDFFEKTGDMGIEDEVAATFIEKCGSESAALEDIETFEGQDLSDERITEISEELNTEEIDTFKDILDDNPGKYTDTDYAKIQDLLEQCGTKAEMDGLRNDIGKLDEYGIKPSDYESRGINTPERVEGAAEAISELKALGLDTEQNIARATRLERAGVSKDNIINVIKNDINSSPYIQKQILNFDEFSYLDEAQKRCIQSAINDGRVDISRWMGKVSGQFEGLTEEEWGAVNKYMINGDKLYRIPETATSKTADFLINDNLKVEFKGMQAETYDNILSQARKFSTKSRWKGSR